MKKLFYAYLFIFLNININIDRVHICLTPTFVGYILLLLAFRELESESSEFSKLRPAALGMAVYTGICWLLDAFGVSGSSTGWVVIRLLLSLVEMGVSLYILKCVIDGIEDIEDLRSADLGSERVRSVFMVMAVAEVVGLAMAIVPVLSIPAMLVTFIATIVLLVRLHATWKAYEDLAWRDFENRH
ncbi:MAG: hypothetical protein K6A91_02125 [Clostridia bacterium]|nr:hypothetical protein [Clostridia bacterium]